MSYIFGESGTSLCTKVSAFQDDGTRQERVLGFRWNSHNYARFIKPGDVAVQSCPPGRLPYALTFERKYRISR